MKKMITLVALASVAVLLVPVTSQAAYTDKGVTLEGHKTITLTGTITSSSGKTCANYTQVQTLTGFQATILSQTFHNPEVKCFVTGTLKSLGCTSLASMTSTGLPYSIDNETTKIKVTSVDMDAVFTGGAFCPKNVTYSGSFTMTPNNPDAISTYSLSGELSTSVAGITAVIGGTVEPVNASDIGTYGLT